MQKDYQTTTSHQMKNTPKNLPSVCFLITFYVFFADTWYFFLVLRAIFVALNLLQFYKITTTKTLVKILDDNCEDVHSATCATNGECAGFFHVDC